MEGLGASIPKLQLISPAFVLLYCKYLWILNEYAKHTGHCMKCILINLLLTVICVGNSEKTKIKPTSK